MLECRACKRQDGSIEIHHLIPRALGGEDGPTAPLCADCHSKLHRIAARFISGRGYSSADPAEVNLILMVEPIVRAYQLREDNPERYQDDQISELRLKITPRQLARLHRIKAEHGFSSLDALMQSVIAKLTGTGGGRAPSGL